MDIMKSVCSPWIRDPSQVVSSYDQWKWIRTKKRGDDGHERKGIYEFAYHVPTGELYYEDAKAVVSVKSFYILFVNPIHVAGRIMYHLIKMQLDILDICYQAYQESSKADVFYKTYRGKITHAIGENIKEMYLCIWYGVGVELAAFFGWVWDPFKARSVISQIEEDWNHGASYGTDLRFNEVGPETTFSLAICFRKRGNIYRDKVRGEMPKYIVKEQFNSFSELAKLNTPFEICFPGYPIIPIKC